MILQTRQRNYYSLTKMTKSQRRAIVELAANQYVITDSVLAEFCLSIYIQNKLDFYKPFVLIKQFDDGYRMIGVFGKGMRDIRQFLGYLCEVVL